MNHHCEDLVLLFDTSFSTSHNTRLIKGGHEPEYLPANGEYGYHRILFTHDYFSSALHEIAHWCVAGKERRLQADYGYWYIPDGRSPQQQQQFEAVEAKPQALEWIFSTACGIPFRISADNLNQSSEPSAAFKNAIVQQAHRYCDGQIGQRARRFVEVLGHFYKTDNVLQKQYYSADSL